MIRIPDPDSGSRMTGTNEQLEAPLAQNFHKVTFILFKL
jgi:hypothetical protein